MKIHFYKYSGTGNDFIVVDNRQGNIPHDSTVAKQWEHLCHRRFGVGADGVLLLEKSTKADFKMVYLNSDGHPANMCGNGARCILHFAAHVLKMVPLPQKFETAKGLYSASYLSNGHISIEMSEISQVDGIKNLPVANAFFVNTGVPHCCIEVTDVNSIDLKTVARPLRFHPIFGAEGANINFYQILAHGKLKLRTYERGVEDETYACGTGATATAIAYFLRQQAITTSTKISSVELEVMGGILSVDLSSYPQKTLLVGPAEMTFEGFLSL